MSSSRQSSGDGKGVRIVAPPTGTVFRASASALACAMTWLACVPKTLAVDIAAAPFGDFLEDDRASAAQDTLGRDGRQGMRRRTSCGVCQSRSEEHTSE